MSRKPSKDQARLARNDESRNRATAHRQQWTQDEIDVLMDWDHTESMLDDLADLLGRTREACRQRFYETLHGKGIAEYREVITTTTTTTTTTIRWADDDEWPDYYVRG